MWAGRLWSVDRSEKLIRGPKKLDWSTSGKGLRYDGTTVRRYHPSSHAAMQPCLHLFLVPSSSSGGGSPPHSPLPTSHMAVIQYSSFSFTFTFTVRGTPLLWRLLVRVERIKTMIRLTSLTKMHHSRKDYL